MGKMVVFKPIVWNDNGYLGPCGTTKSSGYTDTHGYGHEEWNGRPDWIWKGCKVFHTEAKGKMLDYAKEGNLGIIMTTMIEGKFYAVGVGCEVYQNKKKDRAAITKALHVFENGNALWDIPAVKKRKANRAAFDRHWKDAHEWINWRCPQTHFVWFEKPIKIVPNEIIPRKPPRQAIAKMHGSYQQIRPDQALAVVDRGLPAGHPVLDWLSTGDFDEVRNQSVQGAPPPRTKRRNSAATATDPYPRYLWEHEVIVTPKHDALQKAFEKYLDQAGAKNIERNIACVDVRFIDKSKGPVLAEIKPAEVATVRFAIRAAIGQLLDYRQREPNEHRLLVVLGCKPVTREDFRLALDNGFGIAFREGDAFEIEWPTARHL